jgi:hypothetical protein
MKKPFYQLALSTIEDNTVTIETTKHGIFKKQFEAIIKLLNSIESPRTVESARQQYQFKLCTDFEDFMRLLVTSENAFWYQLFLKNHLPELHAKSFILKNIYYDDGFVPPLLFDALTAADHKKPDSPLSEFIYQVYNSMYWSETTLTRIQIIEQASLRNAKLVESINKCRSGDIYMLEEKLRQTLLKLTKG